MKFLSLLVVSSLAGCMLFAGCDKKVDVSSVYGTNIKKVYAAYQVYLGTHSYNGPKDKASFKEYLKTDPTAVSRMKKIEVTPETLGDIFVSERDGQPFKIRYGLNGEQDQAVVFESEGVDGKRMIAFATAIEADQAEYDKFWNGKSKATSGGLNANDFQ